MVSLTRFLVTVVRHFGPGPVMMAVGLVPLLVGLEQRQVAQQLATPAEEVALRDLIAHGLGDKRHVVVKDFTVAGDRYAIHEKTGGLVAWVPVVLPDEPRGNAGLASIPVVPPDGRPARTSLLGPAHVQAIIKFDNVPSEDDLKRVLRQKTSVRGLVRASSEGLDSKAKRLLRENYPGTDFSKCLLIEDEPSAPLPAVYRVELGLGVSLLAAGALSTVIVLWFRLIHRPVKEELAAMCASTTRDGARPRPRSADAILWAQPVDSEAIPWALRANSGGD